VQASQRAVIADMTKKNGSLHSSALALQQENTRLTERLRVLRASVASTSASGDGAEQAAQEAAAASPMPPDKPPGGHTRARAAARNPLLRPVRRPNFTALAAAL
jgi:hypothetical protein